MNITFGGIRNIGAINIEMKESPEDENSLMYNCVNFQLDNRGNRDLDDFDRVFKRFPNSVNKDFITLTVFQKQHGEFEKETPQICLNAKDLEINDENLWIYEKITKMLDKIDEKPLRTYEVNDDYIESEDCQQMLYPINVMGLDKTDTEILLRTSHDPKHAKISSKEMSKTIQDAIIDYMA